MIEPIISGILFGCLIAILIGPVFFLILNTSLHRGFRHAVQVAIGVMMSDALFIFLAYFGSNFVLLLNNYKSVSGIVTAVILLIYGVIIILRKHQRIPVEAIQLNEKVTRPVIFIAKGFMLNAMNPSVLFFWLGVAGTVSVKNDYTISHLVVFYISILATIFATDVFKSWIAHKIKNRITVNFLLWLNRICGAALIIYGIYILAKSV